MPASPSRSLAWLLRDPERRRARSERSREGGDRRLSSSRPTPSSMPRPGPCPTPSDGSATRLRRRARRGAGAHSGGPSCAWSRIELLRSARVTEDNRLERILFWPDRKGTGLKQVQAALATEDPTAAAAGVAGREKASPCRAWARWSSCCSAPARRRSPAPGAHRCAYGAAIAQNLNAIAGAVGEEWRRPDGYADEWSNPGEATPHFRDETEALNELLGVLRRRAGTGPRPAPRRSSARRAPATSRNRRCSGARD